MKEFISPEQANEVLDKYINEKLEEYMKQNVLPNYNYTHEDLNTKVNDDETLLEFIRYSEFLFRLEEADLDQLTDEGLNMYVAKIDLMYAYQSIARCLRRPKRTIKEQHHPLHPSKWEHRPIEGTSPTKN